MIQNTTFAVTVPEDFRLAPNLGYLSRAAGECLHRLAGDAIVKALPLPGQPVATISGGPRDRELNITLSGAAATDETAKAAADYIRDWFDLDTELAPFYRLAAADPLLEAAARLHRGLRLIGIPDLFEALAWGILGQQINLAFAYTLKRRLVEAYGVSVPHEGERLWTFPAPQTIAALEMRDLLPLGLSVRKCEYLIHAAQLIADGTLTKQKLAALDTREAEKTLVAIRGIGPWTANYVMMRCLRKMDAFPIDDVGLHRALHHVTGAAERPSRREIAAMAAGWQGFEAYATFYLWRLLY